MIIDLSQNITKLFILGAGASADYGLPMWDELIELLKAKINSNKEMPFIHKDKIFSWLEKTGKGKQYKTIDECIYYESDSQTHHLDGLDIENEFFQIMKIIFEEKYRVSNDGWIQKLNYKLLENENLRHLIGFISYNYDDILENNLFDYDKILTQKQRQTEHREAINSFSNFQFRAHYPHGNFYPKTSAHLIKEIQTNKTGVHRLVDAITCYNCKANVVRKASRHSEVSLYILGLGGGLKENLLKLDIRFPIHNIIVTISDPKKKDEVTKFLADKFKKQPEEILVFESCKELIEGSF